MNDLKSDLFPSPGCLEGRRLARGRSLKRGEVVPDVKVSQLSGTHYITHQTHKSRVFHSPDHTRGVFCFHGGGSVWTKGEGHVMHSVVVVRTGE